jgi:hypothetical protein
VVECRMKPEVLWEGLTKAIRFPLMDCALCGFEVTVASPGPIPTCRTAAPLPRGRLLASLVRVHAGFDDRSRDGAVLADPARLRPSLSGR